LQQKTESKKENAQLPRQIKNKGLTVFVSNKKYGTKKRPIPTTAKKKILISIYNPSQVFLKYMNLE
jgi:hypothetical protein